MVGGLVREKYKGYWRWGEKNKNKEKKVKKIKDVM